MGVTCLVFSSSSFRYIDVDADAQSKDSRPGSGSAAKRVNSHPDQPFRHECAVSSVSYASHLFPLLLLYFGSILCWSCVVMCMWCAWLVMCVFEYFECHVTIFRCICRCAKFYHVQIVYSCVLVRIFCDVHSTHSTVIYQEANKQQRDCILLDTVCLCPN